MNDYVFFLIILPLLFSLFIITRAVTVLMHEMGHAIPALIFNHKPVKIYVGSYGEEKGLIKFSMLRHLELHLKWNPLKWQKGMVVYPPLNATSTLKEIIITSWGPLTSITLAVLGIWAVFQFDLNGFLKLFSIVFCLSALFDLRNLYPSDTPITLNNGKIIYCDGYQILLLLKEEKEKSSIKKTLQLLDVQRYDKTFALFKKLKPASVNEVIFQKVLNLLQAKEFSKAKEFYSILVSESFFQPDDNILCNMGIVESHLNEDNLALDYYNQSLALNENNIYALNNRGYAYNLIARYEDAIADCDKALAIEPKFAYSYANRGYAKIKLNMTEEGLADINTSISLDNTNAYAYRNLGVYYLDTMEYENALQQLEKARLLDPNTHMLNEYIAMAKNGIGIKTN
jgi:tetratricopeptide (TPR) repeat protein